MRDIRRDHPTGFADFLEAFDPVAEWSLVEVDALEQFVRERPSWADGMPAD